MPKARKPVTAKAVNLKPEEYRAAMLELVRNTHFSAFIDKLRQMRENAIFDSLNDTVAASDRLSLVAKGEVRTYNDIISEFDQLKAQLAEEAGNVEPFAATS